jgi:hypothetical protein
MNNRPSGSKVCVYIWFYIFAGIADIPGSQASRILDNALNAEHATGTDKKRKGKEYFQARFLAEVDQARPSSKILEGLAPIDPELGHTFQPLFHGSILSAIF